CVITAADTMPTRANPKTVVRFMQIVPFRGDSRRDEKWLRSVRAICLELRNARIRRPGQGGPKKSGKKVKNPSPAPPVRKRVPGGPALSRAASGGDNSHWDEGRLSSTAGGLRFIEYPHAQPRPTDRGRGRTLSIDR
ncbi:MAG TPA: hypothetical protein VIK18_03485, partial [Pirellulales bacterium]